MLCGEVIDCCGFVWKILCVCCLCDVDDGICGMMMLGLMGVERRDVAVGVVGERVVGTRFFRFYVVNVDDVRL